MTASVQFVGPVLAHDYMDDGDVVMDVRDAASCHVRSKNEAQSKCPAWRANLNAKLEQLRKLVRQISRRWPGL